MIVAYDRKSHDTADGQEQPHAGSSRVPREEDRAGLDTWADDGASGRSPATVLRNLVRRLKEAGGPLPREPSRQVETKSKLAPPIDAPRRAPVKRSAQSAATAQDAYYRNAWENT
jgi:hypothetical protein